MLITLLPIGSGLKVEIDININESNPNALDYNETMKLTISTDLWYSEKNITQSNLQIKLRLGSVDPIFPHDNTSRMLVSLEIFEWGSVEAFEIDEIGIKIYDSTSSLKFSSDYKPSYDIFNTNNEPAVYLRSFFMNFTNVFESEFDLRIFYNATITEGTTFEVVNEISMVQATIDIDSGTSVFDFQKSNSISVDQVAEGYRRVNLINENTTSIDFKILSDDWWYEITKFNSTAMGYDLKKSGLSEPWFITDITSQNIKARTFTDSRIFPVKFISSDLPSLDFSLDKETGNYTSLNLAGNLNRMMIGMELGYVVYVYRILIPGQTGSASDFFIPNTSNLSAGDVYDIFNITSTSESQPVFNTTKDLIAGTEITGGSLFDRERKISWFKEKGFLSTYKEITATYDINRSVEYTVQTTPYLLDTSNPEWLGSESSILLVNPQILQVETNESNPYQYEFRINETNIDISSNWGDVIIEIDLESLNAGIYEAYLKLIDGFGQSTEYFFVITIEVLDTITSAPFMELSVILLLIPMTFYRLYYTKFKLNN